MTPSDPVSFLRHVFARGGVILHVSEDIPPGATPPWVWLNSNEVLVRPESVEELRRKLQEEPSE